MTFVVLQSLFAFWAGMAVTLAVMLSWSPTLTWVFGVCALSCAGGSVYFTARSFGWGDKKR